MSLETNEGMPPNEITAMLEAGAMVMPDGEEPDEREPEFDQEDLISDPADGPTDEDDNEPILRAGESAPTERHHADPRYRVTDAGVYFTKADDQKVFICSRLDVVALTRDAQWENWGAKVRFRDPDKRIHDLAIAYETDAAVTCARLRSGGLAIYNQLELMAYIRSSRTGARVMCSPRLGWLGACYLLPDKTYGPPAAEPIIYQPLSPPEHFFNTAGTLAEWQENVARLCAGNSRLVFAMSCAFGAPLLAPLRMESGGFHFRGTSSTGKTTSLRVAASVCGGGPGDGYIRTWRTTDNALENIAELHNDGLLCLDELGQLEPDKAGRIAYMLGSGRGKERMTDKGGSQRTASWRILFLSTGEISLAQHARSAGGDWHGGQEGRCGDLQADAGAGMGLFEDIHGWAAPGQFADHLAAASRQYYGTPLRELLKHLAGNRDELIRRAQGWIGEFVAAHVPDASSGEVTRMAKRFGLVATAGELATSLGLTGWPEGEARRAAAVCFSAWREAHGSSSGTDAEHGIRRVRAFIEANPSRFEPVGGDGWGDEEDTQGPVRPPNNRAGWRKRRHDKLANETVTEFLFTTSCFQDEVCKGLDPKVVARALHARGYLRREPNDRDHLTVRPRINDQQPRVYAVSDRILESE
jgi:uncharacterized protein (DUF927 family)